jgi:hypothetical protein
VTLALHWLVSILLVDDFWTVHIDVGVRTRAGVVL